MWWSFCISWIMTHVSLNMKLKCSSYLHQQQLKQKYPTHWSSWALFTDIYTVTVCVWVLCYKCREFLLRYIVYHDVTHRPTVHSVLWIKRQCVKVRADTNLQHSCTHLIELDTLLVPLGVGVGHPQGPEFSPEQVGSILLHVGDIEEENFRRYPLGTVVKVIWKSRGQGSIIRCSIVVIIYNIYTFHL